MQIMAVMCKNLEELMVRDFEVGGGSMFGSLDGRLVGYLNLKPQSFLCLRVSASNKNDLCVPI